MKKENFNIIKKEAVYLGSLLIIFLAIFQIVFYNESFIIVLKIVLSLFWFFVIPGYTLMYYWKEKLDFTERIIIGTAICSGLIGILSYYLGLLGINIKYHIFILPVLIIGTMAVINARKVFKSNGD